VVRDETGNPLVGVLVSVEGSNTTAVTDGSGTFTILAPPQGSLNVSYLGYLSQTVAVGGRSRIEIVCSPDNQLLEDVVVIGYGTQRREAVTGSVASMGGDALREIPAGDITAALVGRIPGMVLSSTSSRPGASMQIRIRGSRSLTASNDPLIVLDGIPFAGQLNDIDPNNIKSLDILKDASSTAIYGSRGANGVIMITTKTGSRGDERPATLTYNSYYGIKIPERYDLMTGDELYAFKQYLLTAPAGTTGLYPGLGTDEAQGVNTDWQDLMTRQGWVTSHDVGVSGGTRTTSYSFGANYYHDQSPVPFNNFSRYSIRANIDAGVGQWVRIGLNTNSNYNYTQGQQFSVNLQQSPLANPFNADGTLKRTVTSASDINFVTTTDVMRDNMDNWRNDTRRFGTFNTIYAEVTAPWVQGLKYRINLGLNYNQQHQGQFTGRGIGSANADAVSTAQLDQNWRTNWSVENLLSYDRVFNNKHSVNAVALFSAEKNVYSSSRITGRDIPNEQMQYWNMGVAAEQIAVPPGNQNYRASGMISYMGRVMYSYADKYMISAAVRSDASSRLAPGHQWHTYPAISAGWNISEESFMQSLTWLDALKIRVGYGQTSNQSVAEYSTLGTLGTSQLNMGNDLLTGYAISTLPNSNLGWEYTQTWNYGIDFTMFRRRLSGTIEYYTQKTHDILQSVALPASGGVGSYMANIGKSQNKGFELSLTGTIIQNRNDWNWTAGLNFFINRNKLLELSSGDKDGRNEGNNWFVGYPIDVLFDYEAIGLWQEGEPFMTDYQTNAVPGSIKVRYLGDYNADRSPTRNIGTEDRVIMSLEPKFQGGFNTRVSWKNLDLTVIGTFQLGGILSGNIYDGGGYNNMLNGRRGQVDVDYWRPDNTDAYWPSPFSPRSNDNILYLNSRALFDASHLTISTITLGYTLPREWMNNAGFRNIRVYATAQNPFVFFSEYKRMSGLTPQTNSGGNQGNTGTGRLLRSNAGVPFTKNFLFGLNLSF
jgi:TonB-linked SusC/RagA family outer membrane protein